MGDDARDENPAVRQLHLFPDGIFVLVARIRAFDQIGLRLDLQQQVDDALELEVESMRAVPAAPAQMIAHAIFRNIAQRMIERLDPHLATAAKRGEPHADTDAIP